MRKMTEAERRARMDKIGLWLATGFTAAWIALGAVIFNI